MVLQVGHDFEQYTRFELQRELLDDSGRLNFISPEERLMYDEILDKENEERKKSNDEELRLRLLTKRGNWDKAKAPSYGNTQLASNMSADYQYTSGPQNQNQ